MAAMPLGEWTRRLGALLAEADDCFMVGTLFGFNRIQAWLAGDRSWSMAGSPRIVAGKPPHHLQLAAVLAMVKDKPSAALKQRRP